MAQSSSEGRFLCPSSSKTAASGLLYTVRNDGSLRFMTGVCTRTDAAARTMLTSSKDDTSGAGPSGPLRVDGSEIAGPRRPQATSPDQPLEELLSCVEAGNTPTTQRRAVTQVASRQPLRPAKRSASVPRDERSDLHRVHDGSLSATKHLPPRVDGAAVEATDARQSAIALRAHLEKQLALSQEKAAHSRGDHVREVKELFDDVAYELVRQVSVSCADRARLLATLWVRSSSMLDAFAAMWRGEEARRDEHTAGLRQQLAEKDAALRRVGAFLKDAIAEAGEEQVRLVQALTDERAQALDASMRHKEECTVAAGAIRELVAENARLRAQLQRRHEHRRGVDLALDTAFRALHTANTPTPVPRLSLGAMTSPTAGFATPAQPAPLMSLGNAIEAVLGLSAGASASNPEDVFSSVSLSPAAQPISASDSVLQTAELGQGRAHASRSDGNNDSETIISRQAAELYALRLTVTDLAHELEKHNDRDRTVYFRSTGANTEARTTRDVGTATMESGAKGRGGGKMR